MPEAHRNLEIVLHKSGLHNDLILYGGVDLENSAVHLSPFEFPAVSQQCLSLSLVELFRLEFEGDVRLHRQVLLSEAQVVN